MQVTFEAINGAFCITDIYADQAAVNVSVLNGFLPRLPFLGPFQSSVNGDASCEEWRVPAELPTDLAAVAPRSLKVFVLTGNTLVGSLPVKWKDWSTIQELRIVNNNITGRLPDWPGMASLTTLDFHSNSLTGTLPLSYGTSTWSQQLKVLNLQSNGGLVGHIPGTWSTMSAEVDLTGTSINGCVPDQIVNQVNMPEVVPCSVDSSDVSTLLDVKRLFDPTGKVLATWQLDPNEYIPTPVPGRCLLQCPGMPKKHSHMILLFEQNHIGLTDTSLISTASMLLMMWMFNCRY